MLYLHPDPLMTSADVSLIRIIPSPFGDYRLDVQLTGGTPDRLAPFFRGHMGQRVAFLVDGRVVSTEVISDRLLRGRIIIANNFSKSDAKAIAVAIRPAGILPP